MYSMLWVNGWYFPLSALNGHIISDCRTPIEIVKKVLNSRSEQIVGHESNLAAIYVNNVIAHLLVDIEPLEDLLTEEECKKLWRLLISTDGSLLRKTCQYIINKNLFEEY